MCAALLLIYFCSACGTTSYTRTELNPTNLTTQIVKFRHKGLFMNSKTTKFALDNLTPRGTRNGLNFGSNEGEVSSEGINAFFGGIANIMNSAAKLMVTSGGSALVPSGTGSPSPKTTGIIRVELPDPPTNSATPIVTPP